MALSAGKAALEDGVYEVAQKQLESYLKRVRKGSEAADEATILLARSLYGQKKYAGMLRLLSPARTGPFAFWRAMAQYELGEYKKALAKLRHFEEECEDRQYVVRAERLMSQCYLMTGNTNDAIAVFARFEEKYSDSPEALGNLLDWSKTLIALGNTALAREVLDKLVARAPRTEAGQEGRYLLGRLLIREKRWDEAKTVLSSLANQEGAADEHRAGACFSLGEVYAAQDMPMEATNELHKGLALAQTPAQKQRGSVLLGRLLLKTGKLDEGVKFLKPFISAVTQDPMAGELQLELAEALLDNGDAEQAADEYQYYLETFSGKKGRAVALNGKAWALLSLPQPQYAEAAALFLKAYELFEDPQEKAKSLIKTADSYFKNNQYKLAAETYERVIDEFPGSALAPQARFQMAESNSRDGKTEDAEMQFKALIEKYPTDPIAEQALLRVTELKKDRGDLLAALAGYEELMNTYTNGSLFVNALHSHGLLCYRLLRFENALADFEKVVELAPESECAEQAFYMRGWCHQMMGREKYALATCAEFVQRFPQSKWTPDVVFWVGEHEFNHGAYENAEKQFLALAEKYPENPLAPAALLRAGESAFKRKEYLLAAEHFAALAKNYSISRELAKARYSQGDALSELCEFASAILIFEEVIKKYPDSYLVDLAWGRKGDCQFALGRDDSGRYEAAMASYRFVVESEKAAPDLKLQAQYKIGRCLQKLGRTDDAFEQYYTKVICAYLDDKASDIRHNPGSDIWFTRAIFDAVEILEADKKWRQAVRLLKRLADSGLPAAEEAQERANKIRLQHWILF